MHSLLCISGGMKTQGKREILNYKYSKALLFLWIFKRLLTLLVFFFLTSSDEFPFSATIFITAEVYFILSRMIIRSEDSSFCPIFYS